MTVSYNTSLSTNKDKVRFLIGDTRTTPAARVKLTDEEIDAVLLLQTNVNLAAAVCAEAVAAKIADEADTKNGSLSVMASKRFDHYMKLAASLRKKGLSAWSGKSFTPGKIKVGGALKSENDTLRDDTDVVQPGFTMTMHDHPGVASATDRDEDPDS